MQAFVQFRPQPPGIWLILENRAGSKICLSAKHDPWPYINYLLFIIKSAYKEFENRLDQIKSPRGAKTQMIEAAIGKFRTSFSLGRIESECPGVSRDMIRRTLRKLQQQGSVVCLGRGPGAEWRKKR